MSKDDYITDFENDNKETINELRSRINLFKANKDGGKPLFMNNDKLLVDNVKPVIIKEPKLALNTPKINVPFQSTPDIPKKDMLQNI